MRKGVLGIRVPQGTPAVKPEVFLIPLVGFVARGYRLGHGGGYFDRTLAGLAPPPVKIGIAFELSRMPTIRPQAHDIPMDLVVTEAGIHAVTAAGLELITDHRRVGAIVRSLLASPADTPVRPLPGRAPKDVDTHRGPARQ